MGLKPTYLQSTIMALSACKLFKTGSAILYSWLTLFSSLSIQVKASMSSSQFRYPPKMEKFGPGDYH